MEVRRIKEDELEKLLSLYKHLHANEDEVSPEALSEAGQRIFTNDSTFIYFVIEKDDLLVSSCNLSIIPNLTRGARSIGLIENVVTHIDYRKQGLGKKVIEHTINYARAKNCYKVMLLSNAHKTEAHQFYERLGFDSGAKKGFIINL
ncbi:MAG: GNAT family N-acetyltransferase [Bacteroidota bacterium]